MIYVVIGMYSLLYIYLIIHYHLREKKLIAKIKILDCENQLIQQYYKKILDDLDIDTLIHMLSGYIRERKK